MSSSPLFSVIVLHYNQEDFLYGAVDSLLSQSYENIEFIFADDCSPSLDAERLAKYVAAHKRANIKKFVLQVNETNVGTVRNVNCAIKKSKGRYILFFAADDCLYDSDTLQNFADSFERLSDDRLVVTGQCHMFDEHLREFQYKYVDEDTANRLNESTAQEQYFEMAHSCLYAMGATAVKRELFDRYGYIDERYTMVEDWSHFLHITREGAEITFCDFDALRHRDGGVSHYKRGHVPPYVLAYRRDLLLIQEHEVIPYLTRFPLKDQRSLLKKYRRARIGYARMLLPDSPTRRIAQALQLLVQRILAYSIKYTHAGLKRTLRILPVPLVLWALFEVLDVLLKHSGAGWSQTVVDALAYRVLHSTLTIVLIANGAAVVLLAILGFLNFCRRSVMRYFADRSLKKFLADREEVADSVGST